MSYDALGRLITEVQENTGGTPILTMVDTYDAAGRKTKQVKNSTTTTFTYDSTERLLRQRGKPSHAGLPPLRALCGRFSGGLQVWPAENAYRRARPIIEWHPGSIN